MVFSLALLYGGVAWALGRCVSDHERHDHGAQKAHDHDSPAVNGLDGAALPIFHCPTEDLRIGPAAQSGSVRLKQAQRVSLSHPAWLYVPAQARSSHSPWLDSVFRSVMVSFQGGGLDRHLLFSVLQI